MQPRLPGTGLFLLAMLAASLWPWGREILHQEHLPAFSVAPPARNLLLLDGDFPNPGLHQYSDGDAFSAVIKVTSADGAEIHLDNVDQADQPVSGQTLVARRGGDKNVAVTVRWMPARQRLALGVELHPDRMTLSDWPALPGIGPKLALAIEKDRQENGDFGSLEGLERVRGIGPKRIETWRPYFR